jgi:hypothetical protein
MLWVGKNIWEEVFKSAFFTDCATFSYLPEARTFLAFLEFFLFLVGFLISDEVVVVIPEKTGSLFPLPNIFKFSS